MNIQHPYLLFLGNAPDQPSAKTASGVVDWRPEWCLGQLRLENCKADLNIPDIGVKEAAEKGAKTLVLGVVNAGGFLPDSWVSVIVEALECGMDVASGLHGKLGDHPAIGSASVRSGGNLWDLRLPAVTFETDDGAKRPGKRVLPVGTDCNVGKKYTALALEKELRSRGVKADFRATGQTGVLISGRGTAIDAVIADFIAGAAAWVSPANDPDHWDCVEGQGSILHPTYAGVTVGLLHGSQADALVLCHDPERKMMRSTQYPVPGIQETMDAVLALGRLTNPNAQFVGIAINSSSLNDEEAKAYMAEVEQAHGLPTEDPFRFGLKRTVENMLSLFP